jgi:hypothetical protein
MLAKAATARVRATYQRDLTIPEKWSRAAIVENMIPPYAPGVRQTYVRVSQKDIEQMQSVSMVFLTRKPLPAPGVYNV